MSHVPDKTQTNLLSYRDKETNKNMENLYAANLVIKLHRNRITKALARLRICTGWPALLVFICYKIDFSRKETHMMFLQCKMDEHEDTSLKRCMGLG